MTQEEIKKLADTCVDALEEVPDGFEITTAMLAVHCGYDASKNDFHEMMEIDMAIRKAARARRIKLDSSKHDGLCEGLPFNLDFAVFHRKSKRNSRNKHE